MIKARESRQNDIVHFSPEETRCKRPCHDIAAALHTTIQHGRPQTEEGQSKRFNHSCCNCNKDPLRRPKSITKPESADASSGWAVQWKQNMGFLLLSRTAAQFSDG
mmetsp:Transcript_1823/g.3396  ORF Transcript_1823/g.3396 Transcript_1823/m.3396 type:complete len:106 (-) Transcript_1823:2709-3026(-)